MAQTKSPPASADNPPAKRSKPVKTLPTDRIKFEKQLDILRAYAGASGMEGKAVTNAEVGGIVNLTEGTISLGNAFWSDVGLLVRSTDGGYVPSEEVKSFQKAAEFGTDSAVAATKLGPLLAKSWAFQRLRPKLSYRPLEEKEAVLELAEEAGAQPSHSPQLRTLLDYLAAGGLIIRDGTMIRLTRGGGNGSGAEPAESTTEPKPLKAGAPGSPAALVTSLQQSEGVVQFQISVRVTMSEIAQWEPTRIAAFFGGIAQVMTAKGKMEGAE